jgi:hypothetical protein
MTPETAQWLTPDPPVKAPDPKFMAEPWALHPYQYVQQNPILYWDPDGNDNAGIDHIDNLATFVEYDALSNDYTVFFSVNDEAHAYTFGADRLASQNEAPEIEIREFSGEPVMIPLSFQPGSRIHAGALEARAQYIADSSSAPAAWARTYSKMAVALGGGAVGDAVMAYTLYRGARWLAATSGARASIRFLKSPRFQAPPGTAAAGGGPRIHMGRQGKHIPGHNNFEPGRSVLTADPEALAARAGTGTQVGRTPVGQPGSRERVVFDDVIGDYVDTSGAAAPTRVGIIHYSRDGIHIVPARPQ